MNTLLYKVLTMLLPLLFSQIFYLKIDEKFDLTNKLSSKLPIQHEWKAAFCFCCAIISILIIGVLGIYVIDVSNTLYNISNGILAGIGIGISSKMSIKKNEL